jgi:hypothetical protein
MVYGGHPDLLPAFFRLNTRSPDFAVKGIPKSGH